MLNDFLWRHWSWICCQPTSSFCKNNGLLREPTRDQYYFLNDVIKAMTPLPCPSLVIIGSTSSVMPCMWISIELRCLMRTSRSLKLTWAGFPPMAARNKMIFPCVKPHTFEFKKKSACLANCIGWKLLPSLITNMSQCMVFFSKIARSDDADFLYIIGFGSNCVAGIKECSYFS